MQTEFDSKSLIDDLEDLFFTWKNCSLCSLHRNRKTPIRGSGLANAKVVVVMDRFGEEAIGSGLAVAGREGLFVQRLFEEAGADPRVLWYTSTVACPTGPYRSDTRGLQPAAKPGEVSACKPRLHKEIHIIKPVFLFSFGSSSLKSLCAKAQKESEVVGKVIEANIKGNLVEYVVPLMPLPSLGTLYKAQKERTMWNKTTELIQSGLATAQEINNLRRDR